MSAQDLTTIRLSYPALVGRKMDQNDLTAFWGHCMKLQGASTGPEVELGAASLLCEQLLCMDEPILIGHVEHLVRAGRLRSYIGYVLANFVLINLKHTEPNARLAAAQKLLKELPALAEKQGVSNTDRELADALMNAYQASASHV